MHTKPCEHIDGSGAKKWLTICKHDELPEAAIYLSYVDKEELLKDVRKFVREVCYIALPMFWVITAVYQLAFIVMATPTTPYEIYLLGAIPGPMLGLMMVAPALFMNSPSLLFMLLQGCLMAIAGELYMFRTMVNPILAHPAKVILDQSQMANTDQTIPLHTTDIQGLIEGIECFAVAWTVMLLISLAVLIMAFMMRNDRSWIGNVGYDSDIEASHQQGNIDVGSWEMFETKAHSLARSEGQYGSVDPEKLHQMLEKLATLRQKVRRDSRSATLPQDMDVKVEV